MGVVIEFKLRDMKKKREAKLVNVWDGCNKPDFLDERILLTTLPDGAMCKYVTVASHHEDAYLEYDIYGTEVFEHMEEIKEPEYMPYNFEDDAELYLGLKCVDLGGGAKFCINYVSDQGSLDRLYKVAITLDGKPVGKLVE